jgi:hypothetical protein
MASQKKPKKIAVDWTITFNKGQTADQMKKHLHGIQVTIFDYLLAKYKARKIDVAFDLTKSRQGSFNLQMSGFAATTSTPTPKPIGGPHFPKKDILKKGPFRVIENPIQPLKEG